jgi:alkanesulfonate monooxygenase SsuD/methylene tetrahydromethanopterin reductase-like flavin-dependent oxidoreductase (luciferase family)
MGAGLVLGVADSSRSSLIQDLAWRLEAVAFDAVTLLARSFPIDAVSDFGAALVGWLGPLTSTNRVVETIATLPMYPTLQADDLSYMIEKVGEAIDKTVDGKEKR